MAKPLSDALLRLTELEPREPPKLTAKEAEVIGECEAFTRGPNGLVLALKPGYLLELYEPGAKATRTIDVGKLAPNMYAMPAFRPDGKRILGGTTLNGFAENDLETGASWLVVNRGKHIAHAAYIDNELYACYISATPPGVWLLRSVGDDSEIVDHVPEDREVLSAFGTPDGRLVLRTRKGFLLYLVRDSKLKPAAEATLTEEDWIDIHIYDEGGRLLLAFDGKVYDIVAPTQRTT